MGPKPPCCPQTPHIPAHSSRGLPSLQHCLCPRSSSQECFEVARTRGESMNKKDEGQGGIIHAMQKW